MIPTRVVEEISRWFMQIIDPATWLLIGHLMIMFPVKLLLMHRGILILMVLFQDHPKGEQVKKEVLSILMVMMIRLPFLITLPYPLMSTRFPCGIFLRETMSGGRDFLVEVMVPRVEFIPSGRVHPVMEHVHIFIIVLVKEPIGMRVCLITMCPSGKNGIISFFLILD